MPSLLFNHSMKRVILWLSVAFVGAAVVLAATSTPAFSVWMGIWEGDLSIYSAIGDCLETSHVKLVSETNGAYPNGIQSIDVSIQVPHKPLEKQTGLYVTDGRGFRRIIKNVLGDTVSDLRGRQLSPTKLYWFNVDTNGVLRESYTESFEGDRVRVFGFHWDGQRSGSYRIIDANYQRQEKTLP